MNRNFNKSQKEALYDFAGGVCTFCKSELGKNWHADHIVPWSQGGATDVTNGQALCQKCNLSKGDKMIRKYKFDVTLRDWQEDCQDIILEKFKSGKKTCLIEATPGGGKTILSLSIFLQLKKQQGYEKVIVLVYGSHMVNAWCYVANDVFNIQLLDAIPTGANINIFDGACVTYAYMHQNHQAIRKYCSEFKVLIISDEKHHLDENKEWGKSFNKFYDVAMGDLGLSGTPWASDNGVIPKTELSEVQRDGKRYTIADYKYSLADAIADGVCRNTYFVAKDIKDVKIKKVTEDDIEICNFADQFDALESLPGSSIAMLKDIDNFESIFNAANEKLLSLRDVKSISDSGGLIIAPNIHSATKFASSVFDMTGIEPVVVHGDIPNASRLITDFRDSTAPWIISVQMISEGVDIKRLRVLLYLSSYRTELAIKQAHGRIIRRVNADDMNDFDSYFYYINFPEIAETITKLHDESDLGKGHYENNFEKRKNDGHGDGPNGSLCHLEQIGGSVHDAHVLTSTSCERFSSEAAAKLATFLKSIETVAGRPTDKSNEDILNFLFPEQSDAKHCKPEKQLPLKDQLRHQSAKAQKYISKEIASCIEKYGLDDYDCYTIGRKHINDMSGCASAKEARTLEMLDAAIEYAKRTSAEIWLADAIKHKKNMDEKGRS
jgi:superfamily II DNA or RNA helicase